MSNDNENNDEISLGALFLAGATLWTGFLIVKEVKESIDKHRENKQRRLNPPAGPAIATSTSTTGSCLRPRSVRLRHQHVQPVQRIPHRVGVGVGDRVRQRRQPPAGPAPAAGLLPRLLTTVSIEVPGPVPPALHGHDSLTGRR
ncbi:hypothetical protein [Kitasatospora sp. NPDC059571]|uniref:hypothetical protein n=1 Tax=Kitasatospora sp. NPDC059571 TaxID=3346871 RepID=UPI00367AF94A